MEKEGFQKYCPFALILIMLSDLLGVSNVISTENYLLVPDKLKICLQHKKVTKR